MTLPLPDSSEPVTGPGGEKVHLNRGQRRIEKIRRQVAHDRNGRHIVPTWLMATVLGLILAGWIYLLITK